MKNRHISLLLGSFLIISSIIGCFDLAIDTKLGHESFWEKYLWKFFLTFVFSGGLILVLEYLDARKSLSGWLVVKDQKQIEYGVPFTGYNRDWIDSDYNPKGIRQCHVDDQGQWHSSEWDNSSDTWWCDTHTKPTHIIQLRTPSL